MALARLSLAEALQAAALNFQAGRLDEAEEILLETLKVAPEAAQAYQLLGFVCFQRGAFSQAVEHLQQACRYAPQDVEIRNNLGNFLKATGDLAAAEAVYKQAIEIDPECFSAYYNLAACLAGQGLLSGAVENYRKCLGLRQDVVEAYYNLAIVLGQLQQSQESLDMYRRCLQINPAFVPAQVNLGNALWKEGAVEAAIEAYRQALSLDDSSAPIYNNLGVAQTSQGMYVEARYAFQRALELDNDFDDALVNLSIVQRLLGEVEKSIDICRSIIAKHPGQSEPYRNLGNALAESRNYGQALDCYRQALQLNGQSYETWLDLAVCLYHAGNLDEARATFARAAQIRPPALAPLLGQAFSEVPAVQGQQARLAKERQLALLTEIESGLQLGNPSWLKEASDFLGVISPQLLPGDELSGELQKQYARIAGKVMRAYYGHIQAPRAAGPVAGQRIKLGIVSKTFGRQANQDYFSQGFLAAVDRSQFEVYLYATAGSRDASGGNRHNSDVFVAQLGFEQLWKRIRADDLQVLIYPCLRDDALSFKLSCLPLARMQCTTWSQLSTSGMTSLDVFFSAELLEPQQAQNNYVEDLVCLPNLGAYIFPGKTKPETWNLESYGIQAEGPVYLCGQPLGAYPVEFDRVWLNIARQVGNAQFVFLSGEPESGLVFRDRLKAVLAAENLDANLRVKILPELTAEEFSGLCQKSTAFLDSPFGGFPALIFAAVEQALPVVAMPGRCMAGRLAAAVMKRLEIDQTLVASWDEYAQVAVELAQKPELRQRIGESISRRRHMLYHDVESMQFLQDYICRKLVAAGSRQQAGER